MSSPSNRTKADKDTSHTQVRKLNLTRERVKDLRVKSGLETGGLYNIGNMSIASSLSSHFRCTSGSN